MTKSKTTASPAAEAKPPAAPPTGDQIKLAVQAVCAITGCGSVDAQSRVSRFSAEKITKIAELEASGRRKDAVRILYR